MSDRVIFHADCNKLLCPVDQIVEQMTLFDLGESKAKREKQYKSWRPLWMPCEKSTAKAA